MKYIAKQTAPEHQDGAFAWEYLYNDDGRLWSVVSNERYSCRENLSYATNAFKKVYEIIHEFSDYDERHMNIFLDETIRHLWYSYAKDMCAVRGKSAPEWKDARVKAKRAIRDYCQACDINRADEIDAAADLLSAVTGIRFVVRDIRGCCQGDYAQLIIPKDEYSDVIKDEIEARYFNTGTEWSVENENGDYILYAYTWAWKDEDTVKQIKEQCDISDDDTLEVYEFDGWEKTAKYKKVV